MRAAYEAVKNELESFAGLSADARIDKLEFEIKWVEDKKKYATWEVARDAYAETLPVNLSTHTHMTAVGPSDPGRRWRRLL